MDESNSIANCRVEDLLAAIASAHVSPGAGAAGAVALGLAAACLGKALTISLKHRAEDLELRQASDTCAQIARLALMDAERDAVEFARFIHSHSSEDANRLMDTGKAVIALANALETLVNRVETRVAANMRGDLVAARALIGAAHTIHAHNESDLERG